MNKINHENIGIVSINASILSIIIALLSAYGFFVYGKLDELEHRIYSESLKINNIRLMTKFTSPRYKFSSLNQFPTNRKYSFIIKRIQSIFELRYQDRSLKKARNQTKELSEQGIELICNLTVLNNIYPFPAYVYINDKGDVVDKSVKEPISFNSIDDVKYWQIALDTIIMNCNFYLFNRKSKFDELILAAENHFTSEIPLLNYESFEIFNKLTNGDISDIMRNKNSISFLADNFIFNITESQTILINSKKYLEDYKLFKKSHINKSTFLIGLIFSCFSFIFGVMIPILFNKTSIIFKIWIPFIFYITFILFIIVKLL